MLLRHSLRHDDYREQAVHLYVFLAMPNNDIMSGSGIRWHCAYNKKHRYFRIHHIFVTSRAQPQIYSYALSMSCFNCMCVFRYDVANTTIHQFLWQETTTETASKCNKQNPNPIKKIKDFDVIITLNYCKIWTTVYYYDYYYIQKKRIIFC